jgi:hypothetical protein
MIMATTTATPKQETLVTYAQLEQEIIIAEQAILTPFIAGEILTDPSNMVKTSKVDGSINPYWKSGIKKYQARRLRLVTSYKGRVKGNAEKEGINTEGYEPKGLSGKEHLDYADSILTDKETRTKRYVMVEWFEEIKDKPSKYLLGGTELDKAIVNKYINYPTAQPLQAGQQRPVRVLTIGFDSIVTLSINGKKLRVIHP